MVVVSIQRCPIVSKPASHSRRRPQPVKDGSWYPNYTGGVLQFPCWSPVCHCELKGRLVVFPVHGVFDPPVILCLLRWEREGRGSNKPIII